MKSYPEIMRLLLNQEYQQEFDEASYQNAANAVDNKLQRIQGGDKGEKRRMKII